MKTKKRLARFVSLTVIAVVMLWTLPVFAAQSPAVQEATEEVIVKLHKPPMLSSVDGHRVAQRRGGVLKKQVTNHADVVLMKKPKSMPMAQFLRDLKADADVLHAEANVMVYVPNPTPDRVYAAGEVRTLGSAQGVPADPSLTWGYQDIKADMVSACPDASPLVAVIDTGVDYSHPELSGRVVQGRDFHNSDNNPMDDHGHGTHVSGIIAASANNGLGSAGVCSKARILALKALDADGSGSMYNIIQAIYAAADNSDVRIINMSLGSEIGTSLFHDAIDYAVAHGKLVVAAAGNSNTNSPFFPAFWSQYSNGVLSVAANKQDSCKASFSNYGFWVNISAPGVGILSTLPNNSYGSWSGTSMAAPFVSGAAARLLASNPSLQAGEVASIIKTNGNSNLFNNACWPADSAPYPFEGRTSSFEHLDLLMAMGAVGEEPVTTPPVVELLSPTTEDAYSTSSPEMAVSGVVTSETQVSRVTWTNNRGGSGIASGTSLWNINDIALYEGTNVITVTAVDSLGSQGSRELTVNYLPAAGTSVTLALQVSAKEDDASEVISNGSVSYKQTSTYVGKGRIVGYRFQGVEIPKGAVIVSAKLKQFCRDYAAKKISVVYTAEASGTPSAFTSTTRYSISSRPRTQASVSEQPASWIKSSYNESKDLRDVVQEIVNRADWRSGNALNIFASDQGSTDVRIVTLFDGKPVQAAQLEVVYRVQ